MSKKNTKEELTAERQLLNQHYSSKEARLRNRLLKRFRIERPNYWWHQRAVYQKILLVFFALFFLWAGSLYGLAQWYIARHSNERLVIGTTFIPRYARHFGLDPQDTMQALIDDLGFKRFRLVSYWNDIEVSPGVYDFSELDWQFAKVRQAGGSVSLSIGLRQPRWPECHAPKWAKSSGKELWYPRLKVFMQKVLERYKDHPSLVSYQLENEYFLSVFGECARFGADRERLIDEYSLVKSIDNNTPVILSLANNYFGVPVGKPLPDQYGVSVYKRLWEQTITKRYFEYPFPSWYYAGRAGLGEILTGKPSMIHELQTEPWGPKGIKDMSIAEQDKSMNVQRLRERIDYAQNSGMRTVDLWGAEWWYWRKVKLQDPSLWDTVREGMRDKQCQSGACF